MRKSERQELNCVVDHCYSHFHRLHVRLIRQRQKCVCVYTRHPRKRKVHCTYSAFRFFPYGLVTLNCNLQCTTIVLRVLQLSVASHSSIVHGLK